MNYNVVTRNTELTKGMEEAIKNATSKLDKYFNQDTLIQLTITVEKQSQVVEIAINFNGQVLRAEVEGDNMYKIIDDAVDTLERQILRFKTKLRNKSRQTEVGPFSRDFLNINEEDTDDGITIKRKKKFAIKPMSAEEAVMQMELVDHAFYVYLDADTEEVNVVYKRKNNSYGLIEPIFD